MKPMTNFSGHRLGVSTLTMRIPEENLPFFRVRSMGPKKNENPDKTFITLSSSPLFSFSLSPSPLLHFLFGHAFSNQFRKLWANVQSATLHASILPCLIRFGLSSRCFLMVSCLMTATEPTLPLIRNKAPPLSSDWFRSEL